MHIKPQKVTLCAYCINFKKRDNRFPSVLSWTRDEKRYTFQ